MDLIKKLEARAKELDRRVQQALVSGSYDQQAADDRDLLLEAVGQIEAQEERYWSLSRDSD